MSDQSSPPPAKTDGQGTTENNGAQDTVKSLELARQTLADAGQAGPAELIQQQIDALKGKAKESDKGTTNSPLSKIKSLRWKRVKLVKQIARTKDEEQNLRKKAAEALVEAENAKSRFEQLQVELAKVDAEVADACVAVQSEGVQATSAQQFLRIETHLHKLSERQKGESGVSELLAAANAATQALADKLASVVPAMDLAGGTEGNDVKPMDTDAGIRDASSKRTATDLDEAQAAEQLEKWATSVGFDITLLDDDVRSQALRDLCQLGKRMRTT